MCKFVLFQLVRRDSASLRGKTDDGYRSAHFHLNAAIKLNFTHQLAPTSVGWLVGVGLGVAPPPPDPALHPEGAALVIEPSTLLEGAEQIVQGLWKVRG